jgi:colicin import membrane protein
MRVPVGLVLALTLSACGPKTMDARLRDAERMADRASGHLDRAEKAAIQLEPKDMESAAKSELGQKDIELYPESQMHFDRYKELAAKLPQVKAEREKRDLERRLNAARDKIVPRVQAMLEAQEAVTPAAPTRALVETLESKAKAVKEAVDDELDLFVKDADFAAWAKSQRNKVEKAQEAAARAKKGVAFLEGPVVTWREGVALEAEARGKKDPEDKESALREARARLSACDRAAKPFDEDKLTNGIAFVMPAGKPQTPAQLSATCQDELKDVEAQWKKVLASVEAAKAKKKAAEAAEKKARELKEAKEARARAAKEAKEARAEKARQAKEAKARAARELKEKRKKK